jgi:endonuclease/exonuclease/phosphatase family metal-dependent hydrolase
LAAAIRALDVDVLAVQEVEHRVIRSWFVDQPALIRRAARASAHSYAPARRLAIIGTDGVALSARTPIVHDEVLDLPFQTGQSRIALLVELADVTVVTTHLQNEASEAHRQLEWLLKRMQSISGPCILMGDLNLRPADIEAIVGASGFTLAGGGPTNPAHDPIQQIDHIAVRGLGVESVVVGDAPISDHRPLIAELR